MATHALTSSCWLEYRTWDYYMHARIVKVKFFLVFHVSFEGGGIALPETKRSTTSSPLKMDHPKGKFMFQPWIFRGKPAVSFREGKTAAHLITAPLAFASLDAVPHLLLCNVACRHRRSSNPGIAGRAWWSNFQVHPPPGSILAGTIPPKTGEILGLFLQFFTTNIFP